MIFNQIKIKTSLSPLKLPVVSYPIVIYPENLCHNQLKTINTVFSKAPVNLFDSVPYYIVVNHNQSKGYCFEMSFGSSKSSPDIKLSLATPNNA